MIASTRGESGLRRSICTRQGFTLVEMMVAIAIVIIFGAMATATLSRAASTWRDGHRRSYAYDTATVVFQQIEDDLNAARNQYWGMEEAAYDTRIKFWLDHDPLFSGTAIDDPGRARLRFVRGIPDNTTNPRIRAAGDGQDLDADGADEEYYNLQDDDSDGRVDEDLMPLEGLMEVGYMLGLNNNDSTTLYRAVLAPIGDSNTLFDGSNVDGDGDPAVDGTAEPDDVGVALAENILHFEVRCQSQYTTTWDTSEAFDVWANSWSPEPSGPALTWDSDRLSNAGPEFVMDWGSTHFPPDAGDHDDDGVDNDQDPDYVADNVFPSAVMVVVVVGTPADLQRPNSLRLRASVDGSGAGVAPGDIDVIQVTGNLPAYNTQWPYVRVGHEWMRLIQYDADMQEMTVERGVRGTAPPTADHEAGEPVKFGGTFSRVFRNPAGRDYWGQ